MSQINDTTQPEGDLPFEPDVSVNEGHGGLRTDEEMDAFLERAISENFGNDDDDDSQSDDVLEEQEEEPEPEPEEQEQAVGQEDDQDSDDYAEALIALSQSGWSPSDILQLSRKDAVKLGRALGSKAQPQPEQEEESQPSPGDTAPPPPFDLDRMRTVLTEELGGEAATVVTEALSSMAASLSADPRIQGLQQATDGLRNLVLAQAQETSRQRLVDQFPDLDADEVYGRVQARMGVLARTGEYDDVDTLMQHACMIEIPNAGAPSKTKSDVRDRKRRGQPSRPGRTAPREPVSAGDAEDAVLRMLMDPRNTLTPSQVRRKVYGK